LALELLVGLSGHWNIVKVKALPPSPSGTTRAGKSWSVSSRGPASMSITPDSRSARISKKKLAEAVDDLVAAIDELQLAGELGRHRS
jgi:hypothetical protein